MQSMKSLLDPQSIAVIGASPNGGRGTGVIANLRRANFAGTIYAVHPRHTEVAGVACYPSVSELPIAVDCVVIAIAADAACDVLEQAFERGVRAAVVLSSGFGEGGHGGDRVKRLLALSAKGMAFCGPNCFGAINARTGAAMFSGPLPAAPLRPGSVALVSQSGGLGQGVVTPLMRDRSLGFSHFVSCGNQVGTTIEDYVDYFLDDADINVIAIIVEALKHPHRLRAAASKAHALGKTLLVHRVGKSAAGQSMVASHTGALTSNVTIFSAFLRQCGIVEVDDYDQFVEAVELFAVLPREPLCHDVIVVSGSGGGAAAAADALESAGVQAAALEDATQQAFRYCLPGFASVSNPIDCTGSVYDDPELLPKIFQAIGQQSHKSVIAMSALAFPAGSPIMRRLAGNLVDCKRSLDWPVVAYQASPLGGPLDDQIVGSFHEAKIPLLLGVSNAMGTLRYLSVLDRYRQQAKRSESTMPAQDAGAPQQGLSEDFLSVRHALVAHGMQIVDAELASSEDAAAQVFERIAQPVVVKLEEPGLLHKSDIGAVVLNCDSTDAVRRAYRQVTANAQRAGYPDASTVLIQPMVSGGIEVFVGAINDPLFGTAITFGLGGVFIEIMRDAVTEMAPFDLAQAQEMIHGLKGRALLEGARGRACSDIPALADFLVRFSRFAAAYAPHFRSLELNPIIVRPDGQGVVAVDIAIER